MTFGENMIHHTVNKIYNQLQRLVITLLWIKCVVNMESINNTINI